MPELPEVETIRHIVERELTGLEVATIDLRLPKLMRASPLPSLEPLIDCRIIAARRRAKVLVIDFDCDLSLMVHFKLAGQFAIIRPNGERFVAGHPVPAPAGLYPHKTTHLTILFQEGTVAYYSDVRQFGWLRLMPTSAVQAALDAFKFGPEAVGAEHVAAGELATRLARRGIAIKTALLDQTVIAGLGNIYVDEALHRAGIHPAHPANRLPPDAIARLSESIPWSLERGIEQGGAKIIHGRAHPIDGFPQVHGREGEPCVTCGAAVVKTRVGARGTYLCLGCQPPNEPLLSR